MSPLTFRILTAIKRADFTGQPGDAFRCPLSAARYGYGRHYA